MTIRIHGVTNEVQQYLASFPASTDRLKLYLRLPAHTLAEQDGLSSLAKALKVQVPKNWPPPLAEPAGETGRLPWVSYFVTQAKPDQPETLIGLIGVALWPSPNRSLQYGISLLSQFQARGFADEITVALAQWAVAQEGIDRVQADIAPENAAPIALAKRTGFCPLPAETPDGMLRFVYPAR